ncbi:hypothetical protein [Aquirhabdus parva]|uniref:Uncharacterized protein n=1 Tax=Aquirhabdus parva TaxID=2283318 RepID=A0A345P5W7_9GAMM|nr:hypothetical protein [Aquirhabdus parva]AXI02676.1 hypothetical protein HYN46_07430 [Aquirhabdus parva]
MGALTMTFKSNTLLMTRITLLAGLCVITAPVFADNTETINAIGQVATAMGAQGGNNSGTYNQIGQIAGAFGGQQGAANSTSPSNSGGLGQLGQYAGALGLGGAATTNTSLTTQPVLYSDNDLKGMDCLGLELASTRTNNAINKTKANATDLLATVKQEQGQQKSQASAAADIGALILAQRGGKTGEYAKLYQNMKGDPNANSNALDIEIKNLEKMNEQTAEIKVYQKYKNCPGSTTVTPTPAPAQIAAPVAAAATTAAVATTTTKATKKKTKKKVVKKTS